MCFWETNFAFAYATKNSFGTWGKALVAAGLISQPKNRNAKTAGIERKSSQRCKLASNKVCE